MIGKTFYVTLVIAKLQRPKLHYVEEQTLINPERRSDAVRLFSSHRTILDNSLAGLCACVAPRNERWYGTNHGGMVCYQWYGRSNTIHTIVTKVIIIDVQRLTPHIYTTLVVVYICQHFWRLS